MNTIHLNPKDHPAGTRLIVRHTWQVENEIIEAVITEWSPSGRVQLAVNREALKWHAVPLTTYVVLEVLPPADKPPMDTPNPWVTTLDTATIDQVPLTVEQDQPHEPNLASLRADVATVLRIIKSDVSAWTVEQAWAAKRVLWWATNQLGKAPSNGEKPPAEAEEKPMDFAVLRKASETLAKYRFTSFLVWSNEACDTLDTLSESAGSLIDMAERCEEIRAERDRLKGQLAEATASRDYAEQKLVAIESQPSGLSEEEWRTTLALLRTISGYDLSDAADTLRNIIDRLKRQKAVPWIPVVDGKRPEGLGKNDIVVAVYRGAISKSLCVGTDSAEAWVWKCVKYVVCLSDLLATLPNGDERSTGTGCEKPSSADPKVE